MIHPIHLKTLSAAILLALCTASAQADQSAAEPPAVAASAALPKIELQSWEIRRADFAQTVKGVRNGDALARKEFERTVRDFEARPFVRTPLEAMDIMGSVFVPKAGVEKMLPVVVAHAALGYYDALRFATPLGQADLLQGEFFFRRALTLAGPEQAASSKKFFLDNPQLAATLVQQGLALAEDERVSPLYDPRWVTALGREAGPCSNGSVNADCPKQELPSPDEWPKLWKQAKERVAAYYKVEPKPTETEAVTEQKPAS